MIRSHKNRDTQDLLNNNIPAGLPTDIAKKARRCLLQLELSVSLNDMKTPPGNKLHPLTGKREGFHAIWINGKYRLVFRWNDGAHDVEIIDYHDERK